jgi:hypothetical protein
MLKRALYLAISMATISGTAFADIVYVTNNNDSGPGSFRAAVSAANGDNDVDTIDFDSAFFIELQGEVVYESTQGLVIQGHGSMLSGGSVAVDTDTWDSGLFVATGGADLTIADLAFQKSFNNGLAVFLPEGGAGVSIELNNVSVSQSQFFGVLIDGQATTGFNTDDIIHHACVDPHYVDYGASISVIVSNSEIVQNGRLDGGFDISLATGCPQDFDGLRVDQGGVDDLEAWLINTHFDHNLADGAELDEKGEGSVVAWVDGSTFNHNGDTVAVLCTQEARDEQDYYEDDDRCEVGEDVLDLDDGFDIDEEDGGDMEAYVFDTDVNGNHDEGLDFDEAGEGNIVVEVGFVTAIGNEDEALKASEEDVGDVTAAIWDSKFKHGGDDGTQIEEADAGDLTVVVTDSKITHNAKAGINVEQAGSGNGTLDIENTDLRRNDKPYKDDGVTVTEI